MATLTLPFIFTYIFELIKDLDSSNNWIAILKDLASLGTFFTIRIGFLTFFYNQRIKRDEETTKQAVLALKRAYKILTDNRKNTAPVLPDRYIWLTTARMLLKYQKLKAKLKTDLYKIICEEQEEYWRHRFYLLINDYNYQKSYFENYQNQQISPKSAVIVFSFAVSGKIEDINKINIQSYTQTLHDPNLIGFNQYLDKYIADL